MDTSRPVEIALSRGKLAGVLLGSLALMATGVWMLTLDGAEIATLRRSPHPLFVRGVGAFNVLSSGFASVVLARKLLDRRPGLVLDALGLTSRARGLATTFVPWADVAGVEVGELAGQRVLYVLLRDPEAYVARAAPRKRRMAANLRLGLSPVSLPATTLAAPLDRVAELVQAYWETHR